MLSLINRLLNKFSIVQITFISLFTFSTTVLFFAVLSIYSAWKDVQDSNNDKQLLFLLDAFEKVAHNHAVERGLTAGFLGSPNESAKSKLTTQREKADQSIRDMQSFLSRSWPDEINVQRYASSLLEHVKSKQNIRSQVNAQNAPGAFTYYSLLNRYALEAAQNLRLYINTKTIRKGTNGALALAWFKEYAGQARGKINGLLARRNLTQQAKADITSYVNGINGASQYIRILLNEAQVNKFSSAMSSGQSKQIQLVHQALINSQPGTIDQNLMPAEQWFGLATGQIGQIKQILDSQWILQHEEAETNRMNASAMLWFEVVALVVVITMLAIVNIHLVRSLRIRLHRLTVLLRKIAENGDLTLDVRMKGDDELGDISRAIYQTIYAFKDLIVGLASSIRSGARLSDDLNTATQNVLLGADKTHLLANNIATSLEEMSQTSEEIARSASQTFDASGALQEKVSVNIEANLANSEALEQISTNMLEVREKASRMEEQVSSISGILETINSLAEQTNLLALNAAIEAARAGEAGRGFAVVADEVRNLAKGSKESSDRISNLLTDLQDASNNVVVSIESNVSTAEQSLKRAADVKLLSSELVAQVTGVEQLSTTVATASEQQAITIRQIAQDTGEVLDAANIGLDTAKELERIFSNMDTNGKTLQRTMDNFIIESRD